LTVCERRHKVLPIIALTTIGKLYLLKSIFTEIHIPAAVYDEVVARGENRPGTELVAQAEWITTESVDDKERVAALRSTCHLGVGEAEAIALAEQLRADWLLLDDLAARKAAEHRAIKFIGTLGILLLAKDLGLVTRREQSIGGADCLWFSCFRFSLQKGACSSRRNLTGKVPLNLRGCPKSHLVIPA